MDSFENDDFLPRNFVPNAFDIIVIIVSVSSVTTRFSLSFIRPCSDSEEIYQSFFITHNCYDCMPKSGKVLLLDARLSIRKAFFALVFNNARAALVWHAATSSTIGLITISDFINMLIAAYDSKWVKDFPSSAVGRLSSVMFRAA